MKKISLILIFVFSSLHGQISSFPYKENFDSVVVPNLPAGWTTSIAKADTGDFTTSSSTAHSSPNAIISFDAKVAQYLISPQFDFTGKIVDSIKFYDRRTGTYTAGLLLEASVNNDTSFSTLISDTLKINSLDSTKYQLRSFVLPGELNNQSNVHFRWRVVGNGGGTTSTSIRFDDISITIKKAVDLAVTSLTFSPPYPQEGNTISLSVGIANRALAGNFSFTLQLFDSLTLIDSQTKTIFIPAKDSVAVQMNYPSISTGRHPLIAKLVLNGDEDTTNNSCSVVVTAGFRPRTFLINEIMYAPPIGMPEWIEFVNNSIDTISLSGWKVSDAGMTKASIQSAQTVVPPYSYFVVTTDTSALKNFYSITSPLFQASFAALNNTTPDAVVVFDPTNQMIDSVMYSQTWGGTNGKSLERIDTALSSTTQSSWKTSLNPFGATPGKINSVTQKNFDAAASAISISPKFPVAGDQLAIAVTVRNAGKQQLQPIDVLFYVDANKDSLLEVNELRFQQQVASLNANDSIIINANISPLGQGIRLLAVKISAPHDDDSTNNILFSSIAIGVPTKSIVINEIMYAPTGDMPEWIECYNTSESAIDVKNWKISDATTSKCVVTSSSAFIPAHSYFVIAHDSTIQNYFSISSPIFISSFPTLNNSSSDAVVLFDDRGAAIDSVYYHPAWGGINGNSLQRVDYLSASTDSSNWKSELPNPGNENTSARKDFDVEVTHVAATEIANGAQIRVTVFNAGRLSASSLSVKIFHDVNHDSTRQENELLYNTNIGILAPLDSSIIVFNWNDLSAGKQLLIAIVEFAQDQRLNNNIRVGEAVKNFSPQSLIINEIMYEPKTGNAEFVELFNPTADSICLNGWKLMDSPSSSGSRSIIFLPDYFIPSQGFFLVASDSTISLLKTENVFITTSLSLSNSGEDIVLTDLTNTQIDSVRYSPSWHLKNIGTSGRSLEKISPIGNGNDFRNWSSSVSPTGSSPLQKNSIYTVSGTAAKSLSLSPNPFSPDNDGFEDFLTISFSLPNNSSRIRVRIYDVSGRLIRRLATDELSPAHNSILWNGLDDNGVKARIGMYIILLEALDNFGGVIHTMKDVAVVATKL